MHSLNHDSVSKNRAWASRSTSVLSRSDHKGSHHVFCRSFADLPDILQRNVNFISALQEENPSQEAVPQILPNRRFRRWIFAIPGAVRTRGNMPEMKKLKTREQINNWQARLRKRVCEEGMAQALTFWISLVPEVDRRLWWPSSPCAGLANTPLQRSKSVWNTGSNIPPSAPPGGLCSSPYGRGKSNYVWVPIAPHYSPSQDCWSLQSGCKEQKML